MSTDRTLQLKDLAPYLPYGLGMQLNPQYMYVRILDVIIKDGLTTDLEEVLREQWCMLLRPLSDLTKEITHNGETFVPMHKLWALYSPNNPPMNDSHFYFEVVPNWVSVSHLGTASELKILTKQVDHNPYWIINQLIEWHFDVFGLIDAGLAIPIQ